MIRTVQYLSTFDVRCGGDVIAEADCREMICTDVEYRLTRDYGPRPEGRWTVGIRFNSAVHGYYDDMRAMRTRATNTFINRPEDFRRLWDHLVGLPAVAISKRPITARNTVSLTKDYEYYTAHYRGIPRRLIVDYPQIFHLLLEMMRLGFAAAVNHPDKIPELCPYSLLTMRRALADPARARTLYKRLLPVLYRECYQLSTKQQQKHWEYLLDNATPKTLQPWHPDANSCVYWGELENALAESGKNRWHEDDDYDWDDDDDL